VRNPGAVFADVADAIDAVLANASVASVFYPIHKYLSKVSRDVSVIHFAKWPAKTPDTVDCLYVQQTVAVRVLTVQAGTLLLQRCVILFESDA